MSERLRRLLLVVPAARAKPGIHISELAANLACSEAELRKDIDFLACVGTPPFMPDDLIDIELRNDHVYVALPQGFDRPTRLMATEAAALVIAARAVAPQDAVLRSATEKLSRAVTPPQKQLYEALLSRFTVPAGEYSGEVETVLRQAIAERREVEVVYFAQSELSARSRVIRPRAFGTAKGLTYLSLQRDDGAERMYRLDRIASAKLLETRFEPLPAIDLRAALERVASFEQQADLPRATIRFDPTVAEAAKARHAAHRVTPTGAVEVDLPYSTLPWLVSYTLSWGGAAELLGPPEAREALKTAVMQALDAHRN